MSKTGAFIAMRRAALLIAALNLAGTSTSFAQNGVWTSKANMPAARGSLASSVVNEKIYVIGGYDQNFTALAKTEEYDPRTNTWTRKADMPTPRFAHCACAVNGRIYVIGGVSTDIRFLTAVEEYDPTTGIWTAKANMPTARAGLSCSAINGKIYALGGDTLSADGQSTIAVAFVEEYDPMNDTWTAKFDMPIPRGNGFASSVVDDIIYVLGGSNRNGWIEIVEAYYPTFDIWISQNVKMPTPRDNVSASTVNGIIYLIGGQSRAGGSVPTVEAYNPASDSWTTKTSMPGDRLALTTSAVNNKIYAVGGLRAQYPNVTALATVEEFAPGAPTSVETDAISAPTSFVLYQNYPNPFNPSTTISYDLPKSVHVKLVIYNALGKEVRQLVDARETAGRHEIVWDSKNDAGVGIGSGVYFYKILAGELELTRKLLLMK